jgi:hypothetical protein
MHCPRCNGLMVGEYFAAPLMDTYYGFQGHRCLNCGAIVDDVIQANQVLSPPALVVKEARAPAASSSPWH